MSSSGKPEDDHGVGPRDRPGAARPGGARWHEPRPGAPAGPVRCPFCGSADTERISLFGSTLLVSQHYCRACRTVFEYLKR